MDIPDLSPLTVAPYSKDFIVDLVRYKTGWDQRSQVSEKPQLKYLCYYLEDPQIKTKTVVVENEYIDRHYLEDYSEYYARCFSYHPRKCSRIHFFKNEFDSHKFAEALRNNDLKFLDELSKQYIGHAVIRPIPHTFLAKVCVKPYDNLLHDKGYKVIAKKTPLSLFGVPLCVETTAFLEQDKVVAACATSALWTLLNASTEAHSGHLPSPSAITKSATHPHNEGSRTFPTAGLSPQQVARSLKHFGLEPSLLPLEPGNSSLNVLKEHIFGYVNNDVPVLLGGCVYQVTNENQRFKYLGRHFICALGYHLGRDQNDVGAGLNLESHGIDKIYVHDDRYGPFIKLNATMENFKYDGREDDQKDKSGTGLVLSLQDEKRDVFVPDILIIGLYHKIRISYVHIYDICDALHFYLKIASRFIDMTLTVMNLEREKVTHFTKTNESIRIMLNGSWDIALTTNTVLKEEARSSTSFFSFNGILNKTSVLFQSMPKYLWRCRVYKSYNQPDQYTDIIFDATEVPQGPVVIGYITYSKEAELFWKHIEKSIAERAWDSYEIEEKFKVNIGSILNFFSGISRRTYLNTLYGPLGLPMRQLKQGETDEYQNIQIRQDATTVRRGNNSWDKSKLDRNKKYIWVIDELGDLVFGEDVEDTKGGFKGHPTLVDGKPARLGGELYFSIETWRINLKSGAYSSHLSPDSAESRGYIQNVIDNNFTGLSVQSEITT